MPTPEEWAKIRERMASAKDEYLVPDEVAPDDTDTDASEDFAQRARQEGERTFRSALAGGASEDVATARGERRAAALEEQRQSTPVSYGGEPVPWEDDFIEAIASRLPDGTGVLPAWTGDAARALLPQKLDTPDQAKDREGATKANATRAERAAADLARVAGDRLTADELEAAQRGALIEEPMDPEQAKHGLSQPGTIGRSDAQQALVARFPDLARPIDAVNAAADARAATAREADNAAAHEGPGTYALRLLSAPVSAAAGAVEAAATDKSFTETIPARIRGGAGLTGLGIDTGGAVGRTGGGAVEKATGLPVAAKAERAGKILGGMVGFAGDLALPDPTVFAADVGAAKKALTMGEAQVEAAALARNRVSGIPELHAVDARALAQESGAPIADASAFEFARAIARGGGVGGSGDGTSFVGTLARSLGQDLPAEVAAPLVGRAEAILEAQPAAGHAAALEALAVDVAEAAGVKLAPGDGRRALAATYQKARTLETVGEVLSELPPMDRIQGAVAVEAAIGSPEYLAAVRAVNPTLVRVIEDAARVGDQSALADLNNRAKVAQRLADFNRGALGTAPAPVRRAWGMLQSTVGYGTPLIGEDGTILVGDALAGGFKAGADRAVGAMKAGMLAGFLVPNPRFFANNLLTAPAILLSTVGPRLAAGGILSADSVRVMRAMQGGPGADVIVRTATAEYTARDLARIVASNGINRSQAKVELGREAIDDLVTFADRASMGRFRSHWRSLGGYGDNLWAGLADLSDNYFRINVLTRALRDGATPQAAVQLARQSLFDYGKTGTAMEKQILGSLVWFWTFRRNNYLQLFRTAMRRPSVIPALASANGAFSGGNPDEMDATYLATVDYAANTPMFDMVHDEKTGLRYALNGPPIPMVQAVEDLTAAMHLLALMGTDAGRNRGGHGINSALDRAKSATVGNVNPILAYEIAELFGVNVSQGTEAALSKSLDARLVWYLQQSDATWATAVSLFDLEEVEPDKAKMGGNYVPGRRSEEGSGQWKIGTPDGALNWHRMMFGLSALTLARPLREYAPTLAAAAGAVGAEPGAVSPTMGNAPGTSGWAQLGVMAGIVSPVVMPPFDQTAARNKQIQERDVAP